MTKVVHRRLDAEMPVAVTGDGPYVIDKTGKRYLDGSGGAAVCCLGYSHPAVITAVREQIGRMPYVHSSFFTTEPLEELGEQLISWAPPELGHAYFVDSGSEAVEAAIAMARQYFLEIGEPKRHRVIGRRNAYHGMTLGAAAVGDTPERRRPYEPMLMDVVHISPCYPYRGRREHETDEDYGLRVANELETAIQQVGPETVLAFIAETMIGSNNGAVPAVPGYFKRVREICDKYGVLLILDEVFCGAGRTGTFFAFEHEGILPDLVTLAKGLGAGYQPIGATLVSNRIYEAVRSGTGAFAHGHTYSGHATACAAGVAVLNTLREDNLLENIKRMGEELDAALHERLGNHRHVGDIRGRGLLRAVEIVADRATKEPFDPKLELHEGIKAAAMERGLMCYPQGGTVDGLRGDHITLAPAYIIDKTHVAEIADRVAGALDDALVQVGKPT